MKTLTGKAVDREIERHIRYSTKAPKNWAQIKERMRREGTDIAMRLRRQGVKLPWGLFLIIGVALIAIILFIVFRDKGEYGEGKDLDEPVNIRGKSEEQLKGLFGYKKKSQSQREPGRPFDES